MGVIVGWLLQSYVLKQELPSHSLRTGDVEGGFPCLKKVERRVRPPPFHLRISTHNNAKWSTAASNIRCQIQSRIQSDTFSKHTPSTGTWFIDQPQFQKWLSGNNKVLYHFNRFGRHGSQAYWFWPKSVGCPMSHTVKNKSHLQSPWTARSQRAVNVKSPNPKGVILLSG